MCGCANKKLNNISNTPQNTIISNTVRVCEYSINNLNSLLEISNSQEKSIIISQINVYNNNCNMFRSVILPLFNKYNIPYGNG